MAQLVEAIPQILQRIFVPTLFISLVALLVVLFVQFLSGKRHSCRFLSAENGRDALPRVRRTVGTPPAGA